MTPARFPHSDTPGSQLGCQLPRAYRRLQRPSSALDAKASTMCPLQLVKHKHSTKTTKTHTTKTIHDQHTTPTSHQHHPRNKSRLALAPVTGGQHVRSSWDARVHYQVIKHQENTNPTKDFHPLRPDPSGPNSVPSPTPQPHHTISTPPGQTQQ